jgi:hypothetical protein
MPLSSFMPWLRNRGDELVNRCAAMVLRRRMRRAEAQLPPATRAKAAFWRALYLARDARLQRERDARLARRQSQVSPAQEPAPAQDISKADVLAAIARGRTRRQVRRQATREDQGQQ